jgi:hypothetical protein
MNGGSNTVKAKRIKKADHTVVIPDDITKTEEITWMTKGHKLTFEHPAHFDIEFVGESPDSNDAFSFKSKPGSNGESAVVNLKQVTKVTACKYTIKVAGKPPHDPIVIIDPN